MLQNFLWYVQDKEKSPALQAFLAEYLHAEDSSFLKELKEASANSEDLEQLIKDHYILQYIYIIAEKTPIYRDLRTLIILCYVHRELIAQIVTSLADLNHVTPWDWVQQQNDYYKDNGDQRSHCLMRILGFINEHKIIHKINDVHDMLLGGYDPVTNKGYGCQGNENLQNIILEFVGTHHPCFRSLGTLFQNSKLMKQARFVSRARTGYNLTALP